MRLFRLLKPTTLKNRLFVSFVLLILLPFFLLQIRNYADIERIYERRISEQNQYQLDQVKENFEQLKSYMLLTAIQLEKEPAIQAVLTGSVPFEPPGGNAFRKTAESTLKEVKALLPPDGAFIHYTLADLQGNLYASYDAGGTITYDQFIRQPGAVQALDGGGPFVWVNDLPDDLAADPPRGQNLLALYTPIGGENGKPAGLLRVSFDYRGWLQSSINNFLIQQDYYLIDERGNVVYRSRPNIAIPQGIADIVRAQHGGGGTYYLDQDISSLINSSYIMSMKWYLVGQFPLDVYFGDIRTVKRNFFFSFFLFASVFILITFFILSTITRPLAVLRRKMSEIVEKNFQISIPTEKYKGEMLDFAKTFNKMAKDINDLIRRLKVEERQKEAIRFQMLLQQMNPHFLLNTLNTIKWHALEKGDEATGEICVSLGKLLETSLNAELELIHLREELELVGAYVSIQNFRYDHRFEVRYEYDEALQYALVPKLSLQPLVENAIRHGFLQKKREGRIVIRIRAVEQKLVLEVEDNGAGLAAAEAVQTPRRRQPIGLKNVRERLQLMFKAEGSLELLPLPQGTLARMRIPLLISTPFENGGQRHVESSGR